MLRIHQYDLKVFVGRVLVDPVRVQHSKIGATTTDSLLGCRLEGSLVFELIDTLIGWFA